MPNGDFAEIVSYPIAVSFSWWSRIWIGLTYFCGDLRQLGEKPSPIETFRHGRGQIVRSRLRVFP